MTGVELCSDKRFSVYLTEYERVMLYDEDKFKVWEIEDAEGELPDMLGQHDYVRVLTALGIKP